VSTSDPRPSDRHQPKLYDHRQAASASHGVPVYLKPYSADTKSYCLVYKYVNDLPTVALIDSAVGENRTWDLFSGVNGSVTWGGVD